MQPGLASSVDSIVSEASRLFHAPVTLEDTDFHLVTYGSQKGEVDEVRRQSILQRTSAPEVKRWYEGFGIATATTAVAIEPDGHYAVRPRLCLPARWRGVTYGYLWVYNAGNPDPEVVRTGLDLAEHAASYLAQQQRSRDAHAALLNGLFSRDGDEVEHAVTRLRDEGWWPAGAQCCAVVARPQAGAAALNVWQLPRNTLSLVTDNVTTVLVPGNGVSTALHLAELYESQVCIGIGDPRSDPMRWRESWHEATLAADHGADTVTRWAKLGIHRLLAAHPNAELIVDAAAHALLAQPELARTAKTYLDAAGNVAQTASELAIHRQTLYYRLARIESVTGLSLRDGRHRLQLHLALTLAPALTDLRHRPDGPSGFHSS